MSKRIEKKNLIKKLKNLIEGRNFLPSIRFLLLLIFLFGNKYSYSQLPLYNGTGNNKFVRGLVIIKPAQPGEFHTGFQFGFSPQVDPQTGQPWGLAYDYSVNDYVIKSAPDSQKWQVGTISYYEQPEPGDWVESSFENSFRFKILDISRQWEIKITKHHDPKLKNNPHQKIKITWVLIKRVGNQDTQIAEVSEENSTAENIAIQADSNGNIIYWIKYKYQWPEVAGEYTAPDHAFSFKIYH